MKFSVNGIAYFNSQQLNVNESLSNILHLRLPKKVFQEFVGCFKRPVNFQKIVNIKNLSNANIHW